MRRFMILLFSAVFLVMFTQVADAATSVPKADVTYMQIGTVYQDAHYGGRSQALNVLYQGDCDSAGYRVPMPNSGIAWAQLASSFKGSSSMPQCNWVALHAYKGPKKDHWWVGPLPVDHLGDWNDSIDVAQFYNHCICTPVSPVKSAPSAPSGLRYTKSIASFVRSGLPPAEEYHNAPCWSWSNPVYGQSQDVSVFPWSPWKTFSFVPGNFCLVPDENNLNFKAEFQTDGNFVVYNGNRVLYQSHTAGRGRKFSIGPDGNFVIYGIQPNGKAGWLWQTGTAGLTENINLNDHLQGSKIYMQTDGNVLVAGLYGPAVWSWMTGLI